MPLQYIPKKAIDNLFNANHRHAMIQDDTLNITIEELESEARMNTIIYANI